MKNNYYEKRGTRNEMKGRIIGTKGLSKGDLIIGGFSKYFYEIIEIVDEDCIKLINLSKNDGIILNGCLKERRGYYERTGLNNRKINIAEDW